jgi:hypothetical protein
VSRATRLSLSTFVAETDDEDDDDDNDDDDDPDESSVC